MSQRGRIAVIGGTGKVGQHIAGEAVRHGYGVRMLVRNPQKINEQNSSIDILEGTVENRDTIKTLLKDCQAVINTFGQPPKAVPLYSNVTKQILEIMSELQINRYIGVTGGSLTLKNDKKSLLNKAGAKLFETVYTEMLQDKKKEANLLFQTKELDWTLVRLPFVKEREKAAAVKVNAADMPGLTIGNKDIARFLVSQLKGKRYIHQAPFISN